MRIREAGDSALLLELEPVIDAQVNARAVAIAQAVRQEAIAGVRDVTSTYRSVAVYFDPLVADARDIAEALERASAARGSESPGRTIEVPVSYGGDAGPDLEEVARLTGLSADEVVARHCGQTYRVFMLGFLPGFAYLGTLPPELAVPRRPTPRTRVPAGSVAIGGAQTAIYPSASPGGWQIIGHTVLRPFDPARDPAALFAPGDGVRFVRDSTKHDGAIAGPAHDDRPLADASHARQSHQEAARSFVVLRPGLLTTIQDGGRWGHQSSGVPVSGAMDDVSRRVANALVGNDRNTAALEVTVGGLELRIESDVTLAVAGADLEASLDGAACARNAPARTRAGSILRFGARVAGARAYVAFDGGIDVPPALGSRSTHTLAALGGVNGRALAAGDRVALGAAPERAVRRRPEVALLTSGGARVRVLPGPQEEFFSESAYQALVRTRFQVAPDSNRMGYRLTGARLPRIAGPEMISDATFTGAIQVPASGEPILLMADRQTTGGYPQIAVVITADLPSAAQLAPGDWIEFEICTRADAIAALVAQERTLLALG